MAITIYRSRQAVTTAAARTLAYLHRLPVLLLHLDALNLNLLKLELVAGNVVEITLNNPLPASQVDHLNLDVT